VSRQGGSEGKRGLLLRRRMIDDKEHKEQALRLRHTYRPGGEAGREMERGGEAW
jgi:hypothetical protein